MKSLMICSILLFNIGISKHAEAQRNQISMQYVIGFPQSNLKDYLDQTSFRGFAMDFRTMVTKNFAIGADAGVNTFYKRMDYGTYQEGSAAISGVNYRYTNSFPLHATAAYYLNSQKTFSPFVGLGVGTTFSRRDTDIGLYELRTDAWQFSLKPEIGIVSRFSSMLGVKVVLKYNANFKSNELDSQSYLALGVGLVFFN